MIPEGRQCKKCGHVKPLDEFRKTRNGRRRYECKPCYREYHKEWKRKNPESPAKARDRRLRRVYGVTAEWVDAQVCAICGACEALVVDHDHMCCPEQTTCGKCIRGVLCASCNHGLGKFRDSEELLEAAITYLRTRRRDEHT